MVTKSKGKRFVNGIEVVGDEPVESPLSNKGGRGVVYFAGLRRLTLATGAKFYACADCTGEGSVGGRGDVMIHRKHVHGAGTGGRPKSLTVTSPPAPAAPPTPPAPPSLPAPAPAPLPSVPRGRPPSPKSRPAADLPDHIRGMSVQSLLDYAAQADSTAQLFERYQAQLEGWRVACMEKDKRINQLTRELNEERRRIASIMSRFGYVKKPEKGSSEQ